MVTLPASSAAARSSDHARCSPRSQNPSVDRRRPSTSRKKDSASASEAGLTAAHDSGPGMDEAGA